VIRRLHSGYKAFMIRSGQVGSSAPVHFWYIMPSIQIVMKSLSLISSSSVGSRQNDEILHARQLLNEHPGLS
jgi:hypothetical protein